MTPVTSSDPCVNPQTPDEAAWTTVYAAAAPELEGVGGRYFYNEVEVEPAGAAQDRALQHSLWAESCRLTGMADETMVW